MNQNYFQWKNEQNAILFNVTRSLFNQPQISLVKSGNSDREVKTLLLS